MTRVVNRRREPFEVYIGRPSPYGNPFSHMKGTLAKYKVADRAEAIAKFREWFLSQPALVERARRELRGKVLGCWCKPAACHGDVIASIVDGGDGFPEVDLNPTSDRQASLFEVDGSVRAARGPITLGRR